MSEGVCSTLATLATVGLQAGHRVLRALRLSWLRGSRHRANVLLAGEAHRAAAAERSLRENADEGLASLGFVPLQPTDQGGPTPRLPDWDRVVDIAADLRADAVLIAASPSALAQMAGGVVRLRERGIECASGVISKSRIGIGDPP